MDRLDEALTLLGVKQGHQPHQQYALLIAIQSFVGEIGDEQLGQACEGKIVQIRNAITSKAQPQSKELFEIWLVEADGRRILVRNDVTDKSHAQALVCLGNHGAAERGLLHSYVTVPVQDVAYTGEVEKV
jgi:hypothetical protein